MKLNLDKKWFEDRMDSEDNYEVGVGSIPHNINSPYAGTTAGKMPTDTIICHKCGCDTRISKVLCMLIPPEGLKCPHCGEVVVKGPSVVWC